MSRGDEINRGDEWDQGAPPVRTRSGAVTGLAVVGFVFGGLMILCGILGFLGGALLTGAGDATSKVGQIFDEELKRQGKGGLPVGQAAAEVRTAGMILTVYSIVCLLWGGMAIAGGVGMLGRKPWGRLFGLILGGIAGVLVLLGLYMTFTYGFANIIGVLLYAGYAAFAFSVLLNPKIAREFA